MQASSGASLLPCAMVNSLTKNTEEQCKFIIDNDCLEDEATIDYVYLVFCEMTYDLRHLAVSLIAFLVIVLFLNLSAVADEFLCPSLLTVARNLRMSDSLAGVTLLAFGNGCPDIFSSLAAASSGRPELIVGELLGAGIFCTSIVAGLIFINNDFKIARRPLLRDTSFYLLAVYLIWLYCHQGQVTFYGSIAFIVIYVIYLFIALSGQAIHSRMRGEYPLAEAQLQQQQHYCEQHRDQSSSSSNEKPEFTTKTKAIKGGGGGGANEKLENEKHKDQLSGGGGGGGGGADNCERDWFAWRDESGRRRSSVKREQIEMARREIQRSKGRRMSLGSLALQEALQEQEREAHHHHNHHLHQLQQQHNEICKNNNGTHISPSDIGSFHYHENNDVIVDDNNKLPTKVVSVISLTCDHEHDREQEKKVLGTAIQRDEIGILSAPDGALPGETLKKASKGNSFTLGELDDFLFHVNPINSIVWSESRPLVRIMSILRAPVLFLTILTVPVVDNEKRNNNWCRLLNSIHCFMVPCAIILLTRSSSQPTVGDSGADSTTAPTSWQPDNAGATAATAVLSRTYSDLNYVSNTSYSISGRNDSSIERLDLSAAASGFVQQLDEFVSLKLILLLAPGFLLALFVFNTTQAHKAPKYHTVFAYFGFAMSIAWIYVLATEIVSLLKTVGIIFSMSDTAIGLSVLAWGNSLGDIVANLTLAEAGYARMALGASIGAPLLNLLLGFGLSFSLSLKPGELVVIEHVGHTITLLASTLALVLVLLMLSTLAPVGSKKPLGYLLITCYALYFCLAVCLECGLFESLT